MATEVLEPIVTGMWVHAAVSGTYAGEVQDLYTGEPVKLQGHMMHRLLAGADVHLCAPPVPNSKEASCYPVDAARVREALAAYPPMVFAGQHCWYSEAGSVKTARLMDGDGSVACSRLLNSRPARHYLVVLRVELARKGRRPLVVFRAPGVPSPSRLNRLSGPRLTELLVSQAVAGIGRFADYQRVRAAAGQAQVHAARAQGARADLAQHVLELLAVRDQLAAGLAAVHA